MPDYRARHAQLFQIARKLHLEVARIRDVILGPAGPLFQRLCRTDEFVSEADALVTLIHEQLPPEILFEQDACVRLARGILISQEHRWFIVEVPGEDVGEPTPWVRYIVDPSTPDVMPQCLLIGPGSPLLLAYQERERPELNLSM
jgi:hypothetical protein